MGSRAHVFVTGRVQGIFFRQRLCDIARSLCVSGWVRNLEDGRVEAVFEGDPESVKTAVKWCRKGPEGASVEDAVVDYAEKAEGIGGFNIRH
ncbi:MAG: acylphosphatase [Candidatus Altiarchaeota archaeon]